MVRANNSHARNVYLNMKNKSNFVVDRFCHNKDISSIEFSNIEAEHTKEKNTRG